tara:strand:+ start:278 stop:499 length:222 start_codon:yes stop_codon:yes gene_type:complete
MIGFLVVIGALGIVSYFLFVPQLATNIIMSTDNQSMLTAYQYVGIFNLWWYGSLVIFFIGIILFFIDIYKNKY